MVKINQIIRTKRKELSLTQEADCRIVRGVRFGGK